MIFLPVTTNKKVQVHIEVTYIQLAML